jgi:SAM-dependent methyltransferase
MQVFSCGRYFYTMTPPPDTYDRVPYTSHAYAESHPGRLGVVARLSGWNAPSLAGARVLEVGCGRGGNLLAMALGLPGARFVGVERSERQAAEARSLAERLGIDNVTIHAASFHDAPVADAGFDFVVAHGVCSWIAAEDRRALLAGIARWLSPDGVAYVSFNVLPGWYERLAARDWLRFGASSESAPRSLRWLREAVSPELAGYRAELARVEARLLETSPAYAAHEYLEGENHPQLVSELLGEASEAGLAYLGDAIPSLVAVETLAEPVQALVEKLDTIRAQQLVDFVRCTAFRRMLLVRSDTREARGWRWPVRLEPGRVQGLRIASRLRPTADESLFTGPGESVQVGSPLTRSALRKLADVAPRALPFAELTGSATDAESAFLARELTDLWLSVDGIDFHDHDPPFVATVSERPRACPLARWQVVRGEPVTNRWHQEVRLAEPLVRGVLARADGARTAAEIADAMQTEVDLVRASLDLLARSALLVE